MYQIRNPLFALLTSEVQSVAGQTSSSPSKNSSQRDSAFRDWMRENMWRKRRPCYCEVSSFDNMRIRS